MKFQLKYSRFGERSILIEWPSKIDESILSDIINYKQYLQNKLVKLKVEIVSTYNSILVSYNFTIENINDKISDLKEAYLQIDTSKQRSSTLWEIPVCYHDEFGIDLENLSSAKSLSKSEIIYLHSQQIYTVYFVGFLPGFLYLGGLDKSLHINRKSTPHLNIKKGAVGIGGNQTGIYPQNSPGGWHIIGQSPIDFFDPKSDCICFAKAGDKIRFKAISKFEYLRISEEVKQGIFKLKSSSYD
ncbi:inhibitor of KinA [Winogradskyella wandonensis]|uniref:Inhibitor of KinA n=1 Tax=Winogradskyella wandonensis TaxID=1442586 RepID=A0A4R1KV09_9FLAO|nr:5-oxoprolinase subunit PxpB [Winogradskyella wandonensis]TCK69008.1 inhibitor of KinA [Winogradskyella wandonensis]